jgi:hypothetical protein
VSEVDAGLDQVLYLDNGHALPSCPSAEKQVKENRHQTLVAKLMTEPPLVIRVKKVIVALGPGRVKGF